MGSAPDAASAPSASPVEIFSIGTELLIGRIQDSNSFWLAQQVSELGATVGRITVVGDHGPTIVEALGDALRRGARTILTTGGLGPTPDDLTVDCVAELVGVGTTVHRPVLTDFAKRRELREEDLSTALRKMATVPEGADVLLNPAGLAPCIRLRRGETTFLLLPGPPGEVQAVFDRYVRDYFGDAAPGFRLARRIYVNMHEGELAPHARQVMDAVPGTYIKGYIALANQQRLPVDVVVTGADEPEAQQHLERAVTMLGALVAGVGRYLTG
jgi:molybdenum cofactor synthesis domain-containing protein